jgi:hypothetical protein
MKLPETLSRKAIIATFDKLEPVVWEKLFEREDSNGLGKHRVLGDDYQRKAYYRTEGVMAWLMRERPLHPRRLPHQPRLAAAKHQSLEGHYAPARIASFWRLAAPQ